MGETVDIPNEQERAQDMVDKAANRSKSETPREKQERTVPGEGEGQGEG